MSVPMSQFVAKTINYVSNQNVSVDLPQAKGHYVDRIELRLTGTLTIGTADATAKHEDNPMSIVKDIMLKLGSAVPRHLTFSEAYFLDNIQYKTPPERTEIALTQAAHPFIAVCYIDSGKFKGDFPFWIPVDRADLSKFELEVQWGTTTDLATPDTTTTLVLSNTKIEVILHEFIGRPPIGSGMGTKFLEQNALKQVFTAATANSIRLPRMHLYRGLFLYAVDNGVRSNAIITDIEVISDTLNRHIVTTFLKTQSANKSKYGLASIPTGIALIDFPTPLAARNFSEFDLKATSIGPTGTSYVRVIPIVEVG